MKEMKKQSSSDTLVLTKKKINKKQLYIIIAASALVLLIAAYAIISAVINSAKGQSGGGTGAPPPEILDGEGIYNNSAVVYPYVPKSKILTIMVKKIKDTDGDSFAMSRQDAKEDFILYYEDASGELVPYYPSILSKEDTDYSDFYAKENADGLNAAKIDYLCAAIGALYFEERIEPEEDRVAQLNRYGLNAEDRITVSLTYLDADGNKKTSKIYIGDSLITGVGFYFMLDGRDYIYTSAASERFEYLTGDFESFLHSRLVAQGLPSDGLYGPYLTTDYKQWTNTYHNADGTPIADGSEIIVDANVVNPIYKPDGSTNIGDGYRYEGYEKMSIDLSYISRRPEFSRLISTLKSKVVGEYTDNEIVASIITGVNEAELGVSYKYVIRGIEALITDNGEFETEGMAVGDNDLIKVKYDYYIDGEQKNTERAHAIIDLSEEFFCDSKFEDAVRDIREAKIGDSLFIELETEYTEQTAKERVVELVITDIVLIAKIVDGDVVYLDEIEEDSIVTYRYKYLVDGYEIGKEGSSTVDLSAITEGEDLEIKNAIIGKGLSSGLEMSVVENVTYSQYFDDFITYRIRDIIGFVEKEMIVSFEFVNSSERDPFYGESIYKNSLENGNKYYALDAIACQNVTYLLGGIGINSNTQATDGLVGIETVAVGLTPAKMLEYKLYEGYSVYFELPRGITSITGTDDFKYLSTLGFNLYISKPQTDGTRFVGSDLYDIIVKVDGASFDYLEKSFDEYWARRNLVMLDYTSIDKIDVEFGMTDVYGKYSFDLDHKTIYIVGNEHYDVKPETGGTEYNFVTVTVRPLSESCSDSAFKRVLLSEGRDSITLANLYNRVAGLTSSDYGLSIGHDTAGTAYFKEVLRLLYGTNYTGVMTDEEALEAKKSAPKIMSLTITLIEQSYGYRYDFYRASDRRVMVHLYRVDSKGNAVQNSADEVSGFYVSTFAAKKIVNAFSTLLDGKPVDINDLFWD